MEHAGQLGSQDGLSWLRAALSQVVTKTLSSPNELETGLGHCPQV